MKKLKLLFFTGAGISAESGLSTFRDNENGLWCNQRIEDVCSYEGWQRNPERVLEFYNQRREECMKSKPNLAHELISKLQDKFDVSVVTQNVDDLHERAGTKNVIHLHGELLKSRSSVDDSLIYPCSRKIQLGDYCEMKSQLRPHIVWFGEMLDESNLLEAKKRAVQCNICIIIGCSMQVYPANTIPYYLSDKAKLIVIDPNEISLETKGEFEAYFIQKTAIEGMTEMYDSMNKLA
jgi:NAD-dependent deacetylase